MSTRWYPIYQRGNPQLRVFLPNFWLKLIKPKTKPPLNVVHFECSMEMTKFDVKNYLEKIYNIPVVNVRTFIRLGKFRKALGKNYIVKDDDEKIAVITMPKSSQFTFPNLFPEKVDEDKSKKEEDNREEIQDQWDKRIQKHKLRPGVPTWFTI